MAPLFPLGRLVATPAALVLLRSAGEDLLPALLERHQSGDWGDVPPEDARENEFSVRHGFRVISSYQVSGESLWVITEVEQEHHHAVIALGILSSWGCLMPRPYRGSDSLYSPLFS